MSELSSTDRYLLKAEGRFESFSSPQSRVPNPDVNLGTMSNVQEWQKEFSDSFDKTTLKFLIGLILPLFLLIELALPTPSHATDLQSGISGFMLAMSLSALFVMCIAMVRKPSRERFDLELRMSNAKTYYWYSAPKSAIKTYEFYSNAVRSLRAEELPLDTELALRDIDVEMQLGLRVLKAEGENQARLAAIEDLAVKTDALALVHKDQREKAEALLASALATEGVNVLALIERVAEDTAILVESDRELQSE